MPSDDELRRVAEDVRALARSLGRDIRAALDRGREELYGSSEGTGPDGRRTARDDLAAAGRAARDELRQAQIAVRQSAREHRRARADRRRSGRGPWNRCPPRWDNWGRAHHRDALGPRFGSPPGPGPDGRDDDRLPRPAPPPAAPIRHRHDGSTLLGLLAVVFGLAWLAAGTHLATVSTEAVLAISLMVVGAATVVTARTDWALSRRSWPVIAGGAVAMALLAFSASPGLPVGFRHLEFGQQNIAPTAWADLPPMIHGGFGTTSVDLSALPAPLPEARSLEIDNAAGRLEIILPNNVPVQLVARIAGGRLEVNGVAKSGLRQVANESLNRTASRPILTLRLQAGFGSVAVMLRSASPVPSPPPTAPSAPPTPVGIG